MALVRNRPHAIAIGPPEAEPGDGALVARAKDGDAAAVTLLYRRYVGRVFACALQRLEDREAAEDATQTVFLRAVGSLRSCRDGDAFGGWLFAIARNVVNDAHRARRHDVDPIAADFDREDPEPSPEVFALRREERDALLAARERCLNEREREFLDLLLADLSDKEIATVLGKRHGAVRTAHWRLTAKLRACLERQDAGREANRVVA